jgi:hypothetical protein
MSNEILPYEELPPDETPVWRYFTLAKMLDFVTSKALFLSRADLLNDAFEGSFTSGSLAGFLAETGSIFTDGLLALSQWVPCRSFVSCWHLSTGESAALWQVYGGRDGALAIRSTVGALRRAFPESHESTPDTLVHQTVRRMQYIDYAHEHPYINDLAGPLSYKRHAFSYEQEIRVIRQVLPTRPSPRPDQPDGKSIVMGSPPTERGIHAQVDVADLVVAVHLAPATPTWQQGTIRRILDLAGYRGMQCQQSSLDDLPEFGTLGA